MRVAVLLCLVLCIQINRTLSVGYEDDGTDSIENAVGDIDFSGTIKEFFLGTENANIPPDVPFSERKHASFPFESTFVLNMARSTVRWNDVSTMLRSASWPFNRFAAVDGQLFGIDAEAAVKASKDVHSRRLLTQYERGNFLSYKKLFDHIVATNTSRALILEDDVQFSPEGNRTIAAIAEYMAQLDSYDPHWDIVWLAWYPVKALLSLDSVFPEFPELFNVSDPSSLDDKEIGLKNVVKTGPSLGLWSFAVSQAGAQKLSQTFKTQFAESDLQIARMHGVYNRTFTDPCTHTESRLPELAMYGIRPHIFRTHDFIDLLNLFDTSTIGAYRFVAHQNQNPACKI